MERPGTSDGGAATAALLATAVGAVLGGLVGLGTIGYWYAADMGWTGSGSTIVGSRAPIVAAALVPAAAVLLGVVTLLVRRDVPARSPRGAVVGFACLSMVAAVWSGVRAYPQVESAELVAIGDDGAVSWRTDLPVTEVFGSRRETAATITLEGRADRRACDWQLRSVTIDRATGTVLDVRALPAVYGDSSQVPPPPTPIEPKRGGFLVEQGSAPFICRN